MKKKKSHTPARDAVAERVRRRDRRMLIRGAIALAVAVPLAAIGLAQYNRRAAARYDLRVVGNGTPTAVLVIDRGSRDATELRNRFDSLRREFEPAVQFRIADLGTPDGAVFASRHQVPSLSVLLFAADGRLRNTLTGLQERQVLADAIRSSFPAARPRS